MKRKKHHIQYTNKRYSRLGIYSLIGSCVSLFWLLFSVIQASIQGDALKNVIGGMGVLVLIWQLFAFALSIRANRQEDVFLGIPRTAFFVALLLLLLWLAIYGLGILYLFGIL